MNPVMQEILIQMSYYFIFGIIIILLFSLLMRGFLWKFIKVRTSFGKLILIKCRSQLRDYFFVGEIKEGLLNFKDKKDGKKFVAKISIDNDSYKAVYRCLGCNWIDINEDKSAVCSVDYKPIAGHDPKKFSDLLTRAFTRPTIKDQKDLIIMILIGACIGFAALSVYFGYTNFDLGEKIFKLIGETCKAVVIPGS